jgi:hypothetical protein
VFCETVISRKRNEPKQNEINRNGTVRRHWWKRPDKIMFLNVVLFIGNLQSFYLFSTVFYNYRDCVTKCSTSDFSSIKPTRSHVRFHVCVHVHVPCPCSMSVFHVRVNGNGHIAWTWTCNMDMDMDMQMNKQHGHRQAAWTWKCSMDMDMQHGHGH